VREGALDVFRLDVARAAVIGNPITVATGVGIDTNTVRGVVSVSRTGVLAHRGSITVHRQLTWMDRAGHTVGVLGPSDEFAPAAPTLAPDGRRAAVQWFARGNVDIWIVESVRGLSSRFTFEPMPDLSPVWSPEGRRIVFESTRDNVSALLVKNVNGADDPQPLIATPDRKLPMDWSSDGRFILYQVQSAKRGADLFALPLDGARTPIAIVETPFDETGGQFSPDGRWVAYTSNASGRDEIYVRPFMRAAADLQISSGGGSQPRWRRDGRELFYAAPDGRLMAVPIMASHDGQTIEAGTSAHLFSARLASGANVYQGQPQYAVAADGRFLVNVSTDTEAAPPISIVLNWDAALKK